MITEVKTRQQKALEFVLLVVGAALITKLCIVTETSILIAMVACFFWSFIWAKLTA